VKLNIDDLNNLDLSNLIPFANGSSDIAFNELAGRSHYRLLAHISKTYDNLKIIDIGTHYGWSALSLSINKNNKIITYDLQNFLKDVTPSILEINNVTFKQKDFLDDLSELEGTDLIFLDVDPHDGFQEKRIYNSLIENKFDGVLLVDDIHLNYNMQSFWNDIHLPKQDLTEFGHYSGTGLVFFNVKNNAQLNK